VIKLNIKLILVLLAVYVMPAFGVFLIDEVDPEFHATHYNSLDPIEKADADLKSEVSFNSFLGKVGEIVTAYKLEDYVGVRLIHRHFSLNPGQVMVENFEKVKDVSSLVTTPHDISLAREKGAVPSAWIFLDSQLAVFEFSTDPAVKVGLKKVKDSQGFLGDIRKVIKEFDLQDLISIGVIAKQSLIAEGDQIYWERNYYGSNLRSVVQLVNPSFYEEKGKTPYYTAWKFIVDGPITRCSMCWSCHDWEDREEECSGDHH